MFYPYFFWKHMFFNTPSSWAPSDLKGTLPAGSTLGVLVPVRHGVGTGAAGGRAPFPLSSLAAGGRSARS